MPSREVIVSTTAVIKASTPLGGERIVSLAQVFDVQETLLRGSIYGVGDLRDLEQPAMRWKGMLTLDIYANTFYSHPTGSVNRQFKHEGDFDNWHLFTNETITIDLYDRVINNREIIDNRFSLEVQNVEEDRLNEFGLRGVIRGSTPTPQEILDLSGIREILVASIEDAAWTGDSFLLQDKNVALRRTSFSYTIPIINKSATFDSPSGPLVIPQPPNPLKETTTPSDDGSSSPVIEEDQGGDTDQDTINVPVPDRNKEFIPAGDPPNL